jgi:hypothetical protein
MQPRSRPYGPPKPCSPIGSLLRTVTKAEKGTTFSPVCLGLYDGLAACVATDSFPLLYLARIETPHGPNIQVQISLNESYRIFPLLDYLTLCLVATSAKRIAKPTSINRENLLVLPLVFLQMSITSDTLTWHLLYSERRKQQERYQNAAGEGDCC